MVQLFALLLEMIKQKKKKKIEFSKGSVFGSVFRKNHLATVVGIETVIMGEEDEQSGKTSETAIF